MMEASNSFGGSFSATFKLKSAALAAKETWSHIQPNISTEIFFIAAATSVRRQDTAKPSNNKDAKSRNKFKPEKKMPETRTFPASDKFLFSSQGERGEIGAPFAGPCPREIEPFARERGELSHGGERIIHL